MIECCLYLLRCCKRRLQSKLWMQRSVLVPPELGYGKDGLLEIPPNSQLELQIEVLSVG